MDNKQRENQPAAESRDQYTHTPDGQGSLEGYEDLVLPPGVSGSNPGFDQSDANVGRRRQNSRIIRNMQTDPLLQRDFSEQKKFRIIGERTIQGKERTSYLLQWEV